MWGKLTAAASQPYKDARTKYGATWPGGAFSLGPKKRKKINNNYPSIPRRSSLRPYPPPPPKKVGFFSYPHFSEWIGSSIKSTAFPFHCPPPQIRSHLNTATVFQFLRRRRRRNRPWKELDYCSEEEQANTLKPQTRNSRFKSPREDKLMLCSLGQRKKQTVTRFKPVYTRVNRPPLPPPMTITRNKGKENGRFIHPTKKIVLKWFKGQL